MNQLFLIGFCIVVFGGTAMGLHKLANRPKIEVACWVITLALFLLFEVLLHYTFC